MLTSIEIKPFPGFYESIFSEDYIEERERYTLENDYPDFEYLSDWRIDSSAYRSEVAKCYANLYISELNSILGTNMKLTAQTIISPREYNFSSDKIVCAVEIEDWPTFIGRLQSLINEPAYYPRLSKIIKENHTSRSGFWSWMSNDIDDWRELLKDTDNTHYLECMLWYLYCIISGHELEDSYEDWGLSSMVWEMTLGSGYTSMAPETERAKRELKKYERQKAIFESSPVIPGLI